MDISNLYEYKRTKLLKEYLYLTNATDAIEFLKKATLQDAQFIDKVLTQLAKDGFHDEGTSLSWEVVKKAIDELRHKGEL